MTNSSAGMSTSPTGIATVLNRTVAILSGLANRRNSSTASGRRDGLARNSSSCDGLCGNARIPLQMRFTVVVSRQDEHVGCRKQLVLGQLITAIGRAHR